MRAGGGAGTCRNCRVPSSFFFSGWLCFVLGGWHFFKGGFFFSGWLAFF